MQPEQQRPKKSRSENVKDDFSQMTFSKKKPEAITFSSLDEYACVMMLEKYSDWKAVMGKTYEVSIGVCKFDFLVNNSLIEYHGINLHSQLKTDFMKTTRSSLRKLPRADKIKVLSALSKELQQQYKIQRRRVAKASEEYSHCDVICVFRPEEFVDSVVLKLENLPKDVTRQKLLTEYHQHKRDYSKLLKQQRKKSRNSFD